MADRLDGWKEISSYLEKGVRTLQRWEQERGLPVHRLQSSRVSHRKQSNVYAFAIELDRWMAAEGGEQPAVGGEQPAVGGEQPAVGGGQPAVGSGQPAVGSGQPAVRNEQPAVGSGQPERVRPVRRRALFVVMFVGFAVPLAVLCGWIFLGGHPNPVSADVEHNGKLVTFDAGGRTLWTRQFEGPLAEELGGHHHIWQLAAIDGASQNSVLFSPLPKQHIPQLKETVICFNPDGAERWQYDPGSRVTWGGVEYPDDYRIWDFSAEGSLPDGKKFTVVVANHVPYFPSQVSVLDDRGARVGEYWNTGHVLDHEVLDVNGDRTDEIVIGGANALHGKAFLAVIRYDLKRAISPIPTNYAPSFAAGAEIAYLEFPRTDVAEVLKMPSQVRRVFRGDGAGLRVELEIAGNPPVPESIYSIDGSSFKVLRMDFAQEFIRLHRQFEEEKKLDHKLTPEETRALMHLDRVGQP